MSKLEAANASQGERLKMAVAAVDSARLELRAVHAALSTKETEATGLTAQLRVRACVRRRGPACEAPTWSPTKT